MTSANPRLYGVELQDDKGHCITELSMIDTNEAWAMARAYSKSYGTRVFIISHGESIGSILAPAQS